VPARSAAKAFGVSLKTVRATETIHRNNRVSTLIAHRVTPIDALTKRQSMHMVMVNPLLSVVVYFV
jgi:hypothetical protein